MKPDIVNYVTCPVCYSDLKIVGKKQQKGKEIESGELECAKGHSFPIIRGVPRLLASPEDVEQVKKSFSDKWRIFEDETFSEKEVEFQHKWYLERYGFGDTKKLNMFLKNKSCVLDAGCGVGRAVGWFSDGTENPVFGIDLSESVEIAHRHYGSRKKVYLIQADIMALPFRKETFDYISCDQVIHHTPQPEEAFNKLVHLLKSNGEIAVYTYRKPGPIREFCNDYIRERTTQMTVDECMKFAESITELGKALAETKATVTISKDIPLLDINAGTYNLQRFIYWNIIKCFWDDEGNYERALAVNFDWYHPKYAYRYTPEELKKWFTNNKMSIENFNLVESGISIRGTKPN